VTATCACALQIRRGKSTKLTTYWEIHCSGRWRCVTLTRTLRWLQRRPVTNILSPSPSFSTHSRVQPIIYPQPLSSNVCVCVRVYVHASVCLRECVCRALCFGQEIDFSPRPSHSLIPRRVSVSMVAYIRGSVPTPPFGYHRSRPTAGPGDGFPDRKNSIHFHKPKPRFLYIIIHIFTRHWSAYVQLMYSEIFFFLYFFRLIL